MLIDLSFSPLLSIGVSAVGTVEGELSVASFLVNHFKRAPFLDFQTPVAVHPCQVVPKGTAAI
jgi:hypothetical protein